MVQRRFPGLVDRRVLPAKAVHIEAGLSQQPHRIQAAGHGSDICVNRV